MEKPDYQNGNETNGGYRNQVENSEVVLEPLTFENLKVAMANCDAGITEKTLGKLGASLISRSTEDHSPSNYSFFRWDRVSPEATQHNGGHEVVPGHLSEEDQKFCQDLLGPRLDPEVSQAVLDLGEIDAGTASKKPAPRTSESLESDSIDSRAGVRNGFPFKDADLDWEEENGNIVPHSDYGPLDSRK